MRNHKIRDSFEGRISLRVSIVVLGTVLFLMTGSLPAQSQVRQLTGKVLQEELVEVMGTGIRMRIVLLETEEGERIPVDLGPIEQVEYLRLEQGDWITVRGHIDRAGNGPVLMADSLITNGSTIPIRRPDLSDRPQPEVIRGRIVDAKEVGIVGKATGNQLALVEIEGTRRQIVMDLGSVDRLRSVVLLDIGDDIEATGRFARIDTRVVFLADQVHVDGKTIQVEHPLLTPDRQIQP